MVRPHSDVEVDYYTWTALHNPNGNVCTLRNCDGQLVKLIKTLRNCLYNDRGIFYFQSWMDDMTQVNKTYSQIDKYAPR